nr:uncharacterized protein LOC110358551 isoform X2 [Columba livia]
MAGVSSFLWVSLISQCLTSHLSVEQRMCENKSSVAKEHLKSPCCCQSDLPGLSLHLGLCPDPTNLAIYEIPPCTGDCRASPRFHLCLHSVRGKFLLRADLFLLSKETRLSIDSDGKAEQEISEPALTWKLCYLPARGQTPPPAKGTRTWPRATADTSVLRSGSPAHPAAQITQHRYSGC